MTDDELDELLRLHEAATPGPWSLDDPDAGPGEIGRSGGMCVGFQYVCEVDPQSPWAEEDAALIAAYRTAVPRLVERMRAADQTIADLSVQAGRLQMERDQLKARAEAAEADSVRTAEALIDMRRRAEAAEAALTVLRDCTCTPKDVYAANMERMRTAEAEVERLSRRFADPGDMEGKLAAALDERDQAEAENARLREALGRYGRHDDGCARYSSRMDGGQVVRNPCTCGLDAALEKSPGKLCVRADREAATARVRELEHRMADMVSMEAHETCCDERARQAEAAVVAWLESDHAYRGTGREADWSRHIARQIHAGAHLKERP